MSKQDLEYVPDKKTYFFERLVFVELHLVHLVFNMIIQRRKKESGTLMQKIYGFSWSNFFLFEVLQFIDAKTLERK